MKQDPSLSIVIPTFNRKDMLREAIDSALAQSLPCEIVVVDHGSSDGTPAVVAEYGDKVVYVRRERDDGPFVCWFDGILNAGGDFIHLNFDDDWMAPDFARRAMAAVGDDVGVVFANPTVCEETRRSVLYAAPALVGGEHDSQHLLDFLVGSAFTISPGCAVFRRKDALEALMVNPVRRTNTYHGAGPDLMMFLHVLGRYPRYAFIAESLVFFRAHEQSITIDAIKDDAKKRGIIATYDEYKMFYLSGVTVHGFMARRLERSVAWLSRAQKRFGSAGCRHAR